MYGNDVHHYHTLCAPGCMEYNARVCNHKYIQHEGEARGLYVLVVTHECIILIQPSLGCINWFVAQYIHKYKVSADSV